VKNASWDSTKYTYLESARRDLQNGVKILVKIFKSVKNSWKKKKNVKTSNFLNPKKFLTLKNPNIG